MLRDEKLTPKFFALAGMDSDELRVKSNEPILQLVQYLNTEVIQSDHYDHNIPKPEFIVEDSGNGDLDIIMKHNTQRKNGDRDPIHVLTLRGKEAQGDTAKYVIDWKQEHIPEEFSCPKHKTYNMPAAAVADIYTGLLDIVQSKYGDNVARGARHNLHPLYAELAEKIDTMIEEKTQQARSEGVEVEFLRADDHFLGSLRSIDIFGPDQRAPVHEQTMYANQFAIARFQVGKSVFKPDAEVSIMNTKGDLITTDEALVELEAAIDQKIEAQKPGAKTAPEM